MPFFMSCVLVVLGDGCLMIIHHQVLSIITFVLGDWMVHGSKFIIISGKRFTLVDTMGLLIAVKVMADSVPSREGATKLLKKVRKNHKNHPRLIRIFADGGFTGEDFMKLIMDLFGLIIEVVLRPQEITGFKILPKRWVVERTYGWFNWWRRLNKD